MRSLRGKDTPRNSKRVDNRLMPTVAANSQSRRPTVSDEPVAPAERASAPIAPNTSVNTLAANGTALRMENRARGEGSSFADP